MKQIYEQFKKEINLKRSIMVMMREETEAQKASKATRTEQLEVYIASKA